MSSSPLIKSTTRKRPHCKDCGQPLKGHAKGYCLLAQPADHEGTPLTIASRISSSASPGPSLGRASPSVDHVGAFPGPQSLSFATTPRPPQAPDLRPVMPCTFDRNDRPSEISASPSVRGPMNVSLVDRIGPKVEVDEDGFPVRPVDDPTPRARSRNGFNNRHSDPISLPRRSFYDYEEPRAAPLRPSGSSIFPDHSASQRPANWQRTPTPSPWMGDQDRDEGSSQGSMSETSSYYSGYNPTGHYNLDHNDRYFYDDDVNFHRISQRAVVGRSESSPESAGFPDDTPSEASASEVGTILSAAPTDRTGLSINTLLQAGAARPVMSIYSIKRELGPHLKRSARKLGLYADVRRPPPDVHGGHNTENVLLAMGRDRNQIHDFVTDPNPNPLVMHSPVRDRELERSRDLHRRDGHRRTSTHDCEHCHSTTPVPHHSALYPHTPVGPHHQNLPPPPGSAPHMYSPQQYGAAMVPPVQPPGSSPISAAVSAIRTVCTIIVVTTAVGAGMVFMLARV